MTREKKEILKKIDNLEITIQAETEMGCGFIPSGWLSETEEEIFKLQECLANLRHYDSVDAMFCDMRGVDVSSLPFV